MKNVFILFIGLILSISSVKANVTSVVATAENKAIKVQLDNTNQEVTILLIDDFDQVLVSETVSEPNHISTFDLKFLPEGSYDLQVTSKSDNELEITTYDVTIKDDKVSLNKPLEQRIFAPSVQVNNNELAVNMMSLNKVTNVTVFFLDAQGNYVDSDQFKVKNSNGRKYNFEALPTGNYTARFYYEGDMVERNFSIQ